MFTINPQYFVDDKCEKPLPWRRQHDKYKNLDCGI